MSLPTGRAAFLALSLFLLAIVLFEYANLALPANSPAASHSPPPLPMHAPHTPDAAQDAAARHVPAPLALFVPSVIPLRNLSELIVLSIDGSDTRGFVCENERASSNGTLPGAASRHRFVITTERDESWSSGTIKCSPKLLVARIAWRQGRIEYYPGEQAARLTDTHAVALTTVANVGFALSTMHYLETKFVYVERHSIPFWMFFGNNISDHMYRFFANGWLNESMLGPWWTMRHVLYPRMTLINAWLKPLAVLEMIRERRFEYVLYLDSDVNVLRPEISPLAFYPPSLNLTQGKDRDVQLVVPGKSASLKLRWSNWIFLSRASDWTQRFMHKWLASAECDCWMDQASQWLALLKMLSEYHGIARLAHVCDYRWSAKARLSVLQIKKAAGCPLNLSSIAEHAKATKCCRYECEMTAPGPMMCDCGVFDCFDDGAYFAMAAIASRKVSASFGDTPLYSANLSGPPRARTAEKFSRRIFWIDDVGMLLPPVWWWRRKVGLNAFGYFDVFVHKNIQRVNKLANHFLLARNHSRPSGLDCMSRRVLKILIPASFALGMGMELFMAYISVGSAGTFYDVNKRKRAERLVEAEMSMPRQVASRQQPPEQQHPS